VAHACNPSYSGGRNQKDQGLKPAWGKQFMRPYLRLVGSKPPCCHLFTQQWFTDCQLCVGNCTSTGTKQGTDSSHQGPASGYCLNYFIFMLSSLQQAEECSPHVFLYKKMAENTQHRAWPGQGLSLCLLPSFWEESFVKHVGLTTSYFPSPPQIH
jgi:hypothetical protein